MVSDLTTTRIKREDKILLMGKCKEDFIKSNPKFKGVKITYPLMITQLIEFYLKN